MPDAKLLPKLIERLLSLTNEGKIDWKETAAENDFQALVGQNIVQVARRKNSDNWDAWDYLIRVMDRKGNLLDDAVDSGFDVNWQIGGQSPYDALMQLYNGARRKALNVDQALADLLSSLDASQ